MKRRRRFENKDAAFLWVLLWHCGTFLHGLDHETIGRRVLVGIFWRMGIHGKSIGWMAATPGSLLLDRGFSRLDFGSLHIYPHLFFTKRIGIKG